jgi:hypothetical protein
MRTSLEDLLYFLQERIRVTIKGDFIRDPLKTAHLVLQTEYIRRDCF